MKEELIDKIKSCQLFRDCDTDSLTQMLENTPYHMAHYHSGRYITRKGDDCTNVLLIVQGTVFTNVINPDGKQLIIDFYTGPIVLAASFVFFDLAKYPVNVVAQTDCTVLYIDNAAFKGWLEHDRQIKNNFIGILSDRGLHLGRLLHDIAFLSLRERVTAYLNVHKKITNVEKLSQSLGVARTSLSRVLSEMKKEGIIERTTEGIELRKEC